MMSNQSPLPLCPPRPNDRRGFEIAVICALTLEADAIVALFDHHWDDDDDGLHFDKEPGDPNAYSTGTIDRHNVVLAYMPGMGKINAATVASNCGKSFPGIKLALVVGVCGVVPFSPGNEELVLGDVIISNGVIQYDFGRQLPGQFVRKNTILDIPGRSNLEIRGILTKLQAVRHRRQLSAKITEYLNVIRHDRDLHAEYPGSTEDRLFESSYLHTDGRMSCEQLRCNGKLVSRSRLANAEISTTPTIHVGLMASGDAVMKSGEDRDRIAAAEGVIAFEMEGAGVWDSFPCIVIKGACDYADSHKSKVWQQYAAATAAACSKALLSFWIPSSIRDPSQTLSAVCKRETQPVFLVPFSKNDIFVGREKILGELQGLLFDKACRKAALVGLGGIGKTQIALQLAYWIKEKKTECSVFWVPALSRAVFEQACVQIMEACGIPNSNNNNAVESVRQYLSSKEAGKWLLVVDNADDVQTVMGLKGANHGLYQSLPQSEEGQILFTTRYRKVAVSVAGRDIIEVPAMERYEARSCLKEALPQEISASDDEVMDHLLTLLAHLPLAITQAAAYINENQIPLTEYIQLFESTDTDRMELLSAEFQDDRRYEQSQDPVATTWFISFDQIRKADELAWSILMFLAYVEPKAVAQSMLPEGKSQQQLTRAIGTLCGYRFLYRRGSSKVFDMHSLVHLATRCWATENRMEKEQRRAAIARLGEVFPTSDWKYRDIWRQYLPHTIKLLRCADDDWSEELCQLGYWAGRCLAVDGRMIEAISAMERVVKTRKRIQAKGHPDQLTSEHGLARLYLSNGQTKKAVRILEHVVRTRQRTLAEDHPDRLASEHVLAVAYSDNQPKKAIEILEHVVKTRQKIQAEDHPHRLTSEHDIVRAYISDGQTKKAIELQERVVETRQRMHAEDHPDRLASEHVLAVAYGDSQTEKAVRILEHVVKIREGTLAEDHPHRLASEHDLARAYLSDGRTKKAVRILEHVVNIQERAP
ncbi:hypothetical protein FDENT_13687 [Fusarium denticulatum]|uniref:Kinesin light chain n=1 Tax=Fusarium denticulatum TaxID=48507 RepID=A0A8H5T140_9HYPO|nr:hypothetical protein FDENT_13687 [Fusarium denticulatum]